MEELLDTWRIHTRIQLAVLDAIAPVALAGVAASRGRSVGEQVAHIHNVRLLWLKAAAPDLLSGLAKLERADATDKDRLRQALTASGEAMTALLRAALANGGRVKGFKPHVVAFVGYLIAHESYHQGDIGVVLTQCGHPLDRATAYGMWEWGVR